MKNGFQSRYESSMPIRILHVDDEPAHLEITEIYLKREAEDDFEIVSVLSVEKALEKLENEDFDVIVSDYMMPKMDGIVFLETVKGDGKYANIPFVLFTVVDGSEVAEEALKKGAERYVTKRGNPATQCNQLARAIRELTQEVKNEGEGKERAGLTHHFLVTVR